MVYIKTFIFNVFYKIYLALPLNPFRTAVPFWGQTSQKISKLSPKRDWGSKGVNTYLVPGTWYQYLVPGTWYQYLVHVIFAGGVLFCLPSPAVEGF